MRRLFSHISISAPRLDVFLVSNQPKHLRNWSSDCLTLFGVISALSTYQNWFRKSGQTTLTNLEPICMGTCGRWFCCVFSMHVVGFLGKIVAHQELFCMMTLLASSAQLQQWQKRENQNKSWKSNWFNKQNKNCELHTFGKISLPSLHN